MTNSSGRLSAAITAGGIGFTAIGLAHFVAPSAFESLTRVAFPENTRGWVYRNGTTETLLGAALTVPQTRPVGWAGVTAYLTFLTYRAIRARR